MDTDTVTMAKDKSKKPATPGTEKYRKDHKMARVRLRLAEAATRAAEAMEQDFTQFVNDAVRERLERLGLWKSISPEPKGD